VEFAFVTDTADSEWLALLDNRGMCSVGISTNFIIGGALLDNRVFISTNGGDTFQEPTRAPTGAGQVRIYLPSGYNPDSDAAFATTRRWANDESALSRSLDGGDTWNQIAFIDTTIDEVIDMTFTPNFPTGFMLVLTYSDETGCMSLWRSGNATAAAPFWERVLCATDDETYGNFEMDADDPALVEWSRDGSTVMLFGEDVDSDQAVWRSSDNAQIFNYWRMMADTINDWVVLDSVTFYAATDDGYYSRGAFGPPKTALAGTDLESIALQPGFTPNDATKDTLVVGSDDGMIYVSTDAGDTFGAGDDVGSGDILVAFDQLNAAVIYFADGDGGDVSKATIGPTATSTGTAANRLSGIAAYKDSATDKASADEWTGIWVSPDNTLYALGGNAVTPTTEDVVTAWGRVTMDNIISFDNVAQGFAVVVDSGALDLASPAQPLKTQSR
jgi:hypothetical protein